LIDAIGQKIVAEYWKPFILNEILNIRIIETHFGAFVDEFLFQLLEEFWCFLLTLTLVTSLS